MIKEYKITEMLYEKCQQVEIKNNEWICRCPLCGDSITKPHVKRFHIDYYPIYNTYMYKCYRCGESNNVYMLYCNLYDATYDEAKEFLDDNIYNSKQIKKRLKKSIIINNNENIKTDLDIDLKKDCYTVNDKPTTRIGQRLIEKLKSFISKRMIKNENFYIAHSGKYKSRIIIPIINNNVLEYFQGRTLYDNIIPKYLNPVVKKENIILHKDKFIKNETIFITEGIIDGMTIGNQGTCCLGAYISDKFIKKLLKYTNNIIICLDNDNAGKKQVLKIIKKSIYSNLLKYFLMPNEFSYIKDINELKTKSNVDNIENFIQLHSYSNFYIKTKLKLI